MKNYYHYFKEISIFRELLIFSFLTLLGNYSFAQTQHDVEGCNSVLEFYNNTNTEIASESGAYYRFKLTNTSDNKITYTLSVENEVNENTTTECVLTDYLLKDFFLKPIIENIDGSPKDYLLTLSKGETLIFYVKVQVETIERATNKSKVVVTAESCPAFRIEEYLYTTFVAGV